MQMLSVQGEVLESAGARTDRLEGPKCLAHGDHLGWRRPVHSLLAAVFGWDMLLRGGAPAGV